MSVHSAYNVLISSCGRRAGLTECFRQSLRNLGNVGGVYGIDSSCSAPTFHLTDRAWKVPRCTEPDFVDRVLQLCEEQGIRLLIPTIDTELPVYATALGAFAAIGVTVCVSAPGAVQICCNKVATYKWLQANGFPTVRQADLSSALLNPSDWPLPLIVKPHDGSASVGVRRVESLLELGLMAEASSGYIVQEIAKGREFTINVYVNRSGECICAVPHLRMEVRAGEVSKGITVKERRLMNLAEAVSEALPGAYGPLNIQCFMDESGTIQIIEMNARFGGGYPLAHRAGGRFTDWLLSELAGKRISYFYDWTDDLAMLRYDEAVFVPGERIRTCSEASALSSTSTTRCT